MLPQQKGKMFFILMVIGVMVMAMGTVQASPVSSSSVGMVDYLYLINHHPDTAKANEALTAEMEKDKQEYNDKSSTLNDADKKALDKQLGQQFQQKRQELLKPIIEQINSVIKDVADSKNLSVIVSKNVVVYGGVDITLDVLQKIGGK